MRLAACSIALLFVACSGPSKPSSESGGDNGDTVSKPDKEAICSAALESLRAANEATWKELAEIAATSKKIEDVAQAICHIYCWRASKCTVELPCETMDVAEVEKLQFEKTVPENNRQCSEACNSWSMTKEQVGILAGCSQDETTDCTAFRACSDAAMVGK